MTIFLVMLILDAHLETVVIILICAAGLKMCVKHPHFRISSFSAAISMFEALSAVMATTGVLSESALLAKPMWTYTRSLHSNRHTAEQRHQSLTKSSQISFIYWLSWTPKVWVHPLHFLSLDDNQDRRPPVPLAVRHKLIGFADVERQVTVIAPCDKAHYQSSVLLCKNGL